MLLRDLLRDYNENMRFILTVSPVPLVATAGSEHVLAATLYSKSVLRAVAGFLPRPMRMSITFRPSKSSPDRQHAGFCYENNLRQRHRCWRGRRDAQFFCPTRQCANPCPNAGSRTGPRARRRGGRVFWRATDLLRRGIAGSLRAMRVCLIRKIPTSAP